MRWVTPLLLWPYAASADFLSFPTISFEALNEVPLIRNLPHLDLKQTIFGVLSTIECRALSKRGHVGELITVNAMGFENDLFNITVSEGISRDKIQVELIRWGSMKKLPSVFAFGCDKAGVFDVNFLVIARNADHTPVGAGVRLCSAQFTCDMRPITTAPLPTISYDDILSLESVRDPATSAEFDNEEASAESIEEALGRSYEQATESELHKTQEDAAPYIVSSGEHYLLEGLLPKSLLSPRNLSKLLEEARNFLNF